MTRRSQEELSLSTILRPHGFPKDITHIIFEYTLPMILSSCGMLFPEVSKTSCIILTSYFRIASFHSSEGDEKLQLANEIREAILSNVYTHEYMSNVGYNSSTIKWYGYGDVFIVDTVLYDPTEDVDLMYMNKQVKEILCWEKPEDGNGEIWGVDDVIKGYIFTSSFGARSKYNYTLVCIWSGIREREIREKSYPLTRWEAEVRTGTRIMAFLPGTDA